jgi:receptor protein-tyrosine kinase
MREDEIERTETAELSDYVRIIRERAWVIVLAVVIVAAVALVVSLMQTPQYRASASLFYQKNNLDQALFGSQVFSNPNQAREVQTGADLMQTEPIASAVAAQAGYDLSVDRLRSMVTVKPQSDSNVIGLEVVSTDPQQAADVANAYVEQFILFRQKNDRATVAAARELVKEELDTLSTGELASAYGLMLKEKHESLRILEAMQNGGFTIAERAATPASPFSPQPVRNTILGLVVGLVLGLGLAFLLDYLDRRLKDEKMLERELGAPVLASVPVVGGRWQKDRKGRRSDIPVGFRDHPSLFEPFRTLRSNLQYFDVDSGKHVYLVTSGLSKEGKTVTTINLALSLAVSGKRVIVVEADMRRPMLNEYLKSENGPGLSSLLARTEGNCDLLQLVRVDDFIPDKNGHERERRGLQRNLYVLPSGPVPPNPAELLASNRMGKLIEELSGMADYVIIDTPPLLPVSDALVLGRHVNGAILTARMHSTTREEVREVRNTFERAGIRIVGAVAVGVKRSPAYYRKRGYGYEYGGYELDY